MIDCAFSLFIFHFSLKNSAFTVLWCNGNTSDSGPEIQGSSPCRTTILDSLTMKGISLEKGYILFALL